MAKDKQPLTDETDPDRPLRVWAVSDGRAGMENQVRGLAEAIAALTPALISVKRVSVDARAEKLPSWAWGNAFDRVAKVTDEKGQPLSHTPPPATIFHNLGEEIWDDFWPDIWIGCGRRIMPITRAAKTQCPETFTVQTQDPRGALKGIDLVIPPAHDGLSGDNVFPIIGAPNRLSLTKATEEAAKLALHLGHLPKPRLAVIIGGDSKAYALDTPALARIIDQLKQAVKSYGLMVTFSRRTGEENEEVIREALSHPDVWVWDGQPIADLDNPYAAMLGLADHIAVTNESTNMVTDAASTGKPVHLLELSGGNAKFRRFHESVSHMTQPFELPLRSKTYEPLRETDRAAREILRRLTATWGTTSLTQS